jgi:hypothetical protein
MGAWDNDPFGNDSALDWVGELEAFDDLSFIEATIKYVLDRGPEFIESDDAEEAIAAADTLARLRGRFYVRNAYTASLDEWVAANPINPPQTLVDSALRALDRILTQPSELLELWEDSGEFESWKQHLEMLRERLK